MALPQPPILVRSIDEDYYINGFGRFIDNPELEEVIIYDQEEYNGCLIKLVKKNDDYYSQHYDYAVLRQENKYDVEQVEYYFAEYNRRNNMN